MSLVLDNFAVTSVRKHQSQVEEAMVLTVLRKGGYRGEYKHTSAMKALLNRTNKIEVLAKTTRIPVVYLRALNKLLVNSAKDSTFEVIVKREHFQEVKDRLSSAGFKRFYVRNESDKDLYCFKIDLGDNFPLISALLGSGVEYRDMVAIVVSALNYMIGIDHAEILEEWQRKHIGVSLPPYTGFLGFVGRSSLGTLEEGSVENYG